MHWILPVELLCDFGEKVLVEEPGYDSKVIMRLNGLTPVPVNVDQDGMQIDLQEHCNNSIRLAYVTPSHQWPTGVSLSLKRRQLLLKWPLKNKSWIFEDDYDSEFRFTQTPLAALQSLDTSHRVIYTGTFSKVLTPSIQTAYLVVPRSLITVFERAYWYTVQRPPIHSQKALAEFISEGHFISHIRKMRKLYDHKQNLFIEAINQHMPIDLRIDRPPGGLQFSLPLHDRVSASEVSRRAAKLNLHVRPMHIYAECKSNCENAIHLGFAVLAEKEIPRKTKLLSRAILGSS